MSTAHADDTALRVLTWNVRDLLGDPLAVARVIRSAEADVVCLQEGPRWPGSRWRLASLARNSGMLFVDGGRSAAGCALLASLRADVRSARSMRLPVQGWLQRPRGAVVAEVAPVGGVGLALGVVHLGLSADERMRHIALLREALSGVGPHRVVVGADLNEPPGGPAWTSWQPLCADPLTAERHAVPERPTGTREPAAVAGQPPTALVTAGTPGESTFSVRRPRRRIDAVLVGGVDVVEYDRWRADPKDLALASDHRPVLAVLSVPRRQRVGTSAPAVG